MRRMELRWPAVGASLGRAIVDAGQPDLVTPHFTATFWYAGSGFGVPYAITYDLANGDVLAVDGPTRIVAEQLGVDPRDLA